MNGMEPPTPSTPNAANKRRTTTHDASLTPTRRYFSRRSNTTKAIPVLPVDVDFVGMFSPFGLLWSLVFLMVPFCYLTILAVMLRELCRWFPDQIHAPLLQSLPVLAHQMDRFQQHRSTAVELWCVLEAVFYIGLKLRIRWLQTRDPLEASLSAAPLMEWEDRAVLWQRMMELEMSDPVAFLSGWFFDAPLEQISRYDIRDFIAWSMFEGRHQEHLTTAELTQLESFVEAAEVRISLHLYGEADDDDDDIENDESESGLQLPPPLRCGETVTKRPRKYFHFSLETHHEEPNFFSNLFESYRARYEQMLHADFHPVQDLKNMVNISDFKPVSDLRNLMAESAQQLEKAEETALATANQMYETLVPSGSPMGKQLSAMSHATYVQLTEAWNSVVNMRERLETARFLSKQRQSIRQQLKGYRVMLNRMRSMSSAVPSKQMAALMRRITDCNEAMEHLESRAQAAFFAATGFAQKNLQPFLKKEPNRFAKYSSDPLLGLATYPLGFHALVLGATEIPLRIMMHRRGFQRLTVGPVAYYFHPGRETLDDDDDDEDGSTGADPNTPVVFVHGIGIGLIVYMPLIDALLESGRPILLPEIPYVSGFRPWQTLNVLQPAVVASTMTAMLATHGFLRATWMGHSYGTTWLSYMCKYATEAVAALVFLDPICFCLHVPRLTKQFVYMRPDPGTVSYMVRTDVVVNWTIQRSFPWAWIVLFVEQIRHVPCAVFLSDKDALVPAQKVEEYLRNSHVPVKDFVVAGKQRNDDDDKEQRLQLPESSTMSCTVFRGDGHGDWTERPAATVPVIAGTVEALCQRAEAS